MKEKLEGEEEGEENKNEINTEVILSQNPKLNVNLAVGFKDQIVRNRQLLNLKILHYNFHAKCWKMLGQAIAQTVTLMSLTI